MMFPSFPLICYFLLGSLCLVRSLPVQENDALLDNGLLLSEFGSSDRKGGKAETSGSDSENVDEKRTENSNTGYLLAGNSNIGTIVGKDVGFRNELGLGANINSGASLDLDADTNLGINTGAGWSGIDFDNQLGLNNNVYVGFNDNKNLELGLNTGRRVGFYTGVGAGLNAGLGTGLNAGAGAGLNAGVGAGLNAGLGAGVGTAVNAGLGADVGTGFNAGLGTGLNAGLGAGLNAGVGAGLNAGLGGGLNAGLGGGLNAGLGAGLNAGLGGGLNAGLGAGLNADLGVDVDTEISTSASIDLNESKEALVLFNEALRIELQKNKYFGSVYSERTSPLVLNVITAAVAQRLSDALSLPRSNLLLLENNIRNLPSSITRTTGLYYDIFADSLTNILSIVHLITPSTAKLLVTIVVKAITSAIANSLRIPFPWTGVIRNDNIDNSYYSAIKGLGKLPYIGIDAIPKLPLGIITRKALEHKQKFGEVLFCKLISNNNFIQAFLFGVPENTYKSISNILGISMADAFGSFNSALFSKQYSNALFRTANKLDYKAYARALSLATAQVLYLLGYSTSGDVYIQTDIATNAIIRALLPGVSAPSQVVLFPDVLRLPLGTQLRGVVPELGIGIGLGINGGVGMDANVGLGVGLNIAAGVGGNGDANLNANAGLGVDIGLGQDTTAVEVTKPRLSVLKVLTQLLANKLYLSTSLSTSVNVVGNNDVIELIAQSVAANFGFPVATVFVNSYYKNIGSNSNATPELDVIPLAAALTDALAEAGLLNSTFTVLKANSIATAVADAVSSLLATSLEPQRKYQTTFTYGQLNKINDYTMYK